MAAVAALTAGAVAIALLLSPSRRPGTPRRPALASLSLAPRDTSIFSESRGPGPDATTGPLLVAKAFAVAEWTSDGSGGLHALAARTAPWASTRLRSAWATAPDPPAPSAAATAQILDASIVDPRADPVVVQVDVERWWITSGGRVVDPVPHLLLLTMTREGDDWKVDDVAAVS